MKTLVIQRHARAEKSARSDFDRKLTDGGKDEAAIVANLLHARSLHPDLILASPAKRAKKTAKIIAKTFQFNKELIVREAAIYNGSGNDLLMLLQTLPASAETVFLVGHNPALLDLINFLSCQPVECLRPAEAVILQFELINWKDIAASACRETLKIALPDQR